MTNTFFWHHAWGGGVRVFKLWWEAFFNKREYSGADWLDLLITKVCYFLLKLWCYNLPCNYVRCGCFTYIHLCSLMFSYNLDEDDVDHMVYLESSR